MHFIPLGCDCTPSFHLKRRRLRKMALPFDWTVLQWNKGLEYINYSIQTQFAFFFEDLVDERFDNGSFKIYSQKHPYCQFIHHDLMNYTTLRKYRDRCWRFLEVLNNDEPKIFFYSIKADNANSEEIAEYVLGFESLKKTLGSHKLVTVVHGNNDAELFKRCITEDLHFVTTSGFDTSPQEWDLILSQYTMLPKEGGQKYTFD